LRKNRVYKSSSTVIKVELGYYVLHKNRGGEPLDKRQVYEERYQEYRRRSVEEELTLSVLDVEMPLVEEWVDTAVRLRAFLDREHHLYVDAIAPFEYRLLREYKGEERGYQALVDIYREEYFLYQQRDNSSRYYLPFNTEENAKAQLSHDYLLLGDDTLVASLFVTFQQELDTHYTENIDNESIKALRQNEAQMLLAFKAEYLALKRQISIDRKMLKLLLETPPDKSLEPSEYPLKSYFAQAYDLLDSDDLVSYLETIDTFTDEQVDSDIARLRSLVQEKIIANNVDAETELAKVTTRDVGEVLTRFAAKEQALLTAYRAQVVNYFAYTHAEEKFIVVHKPFEMYFDNYFADFEQILKYYVLLYREVSVNPLETPYYNKIYTTTKNKILATNANYAEAIEESKLNYISKRQTLTQLKLIKREYEQEIDALLDEYSRYGKLYIHAVSEDASYSAEHQQQVAQLRLQYDLREKNEFF